MSGNQKSSNTGGPQMQRYSSSPYQPLTSQQTREPFHVTNQSNYVGQQQPNQGGSQGPGLRGIPQPAPPNQASTPPNTDLKVPVPQQTPMTPLFVPQTSVRTAQPSYFNRSAGPPSQTQRMPNQQHRAQQQIYPAAAAQAAQYLQMPVAQMYLTTNPMQYYSAGQRPQNFVQSTGLPMYQGQHLPTYPGFATPTQATSAVPFSFYPMPRPGPPQAAATVPSNQTQTSLTNMPMAQPVQQHASFTTKQPKRRPNAIAVIDPLTGTDRLNEIYEQQDTSHPPSGESSARQTPQPQSTHDVSKEVQAQFAQQVAQAMSSETDNDLRSSTSGEMDSTLYHSSEQAVQHSNRIDQLVQSSNLKVQAKEYTPNTAKETPIVSANCDAVEVTLPNKQSKDRESPAKGRKQREQFHKEPSKESISKDFHSTDKLPSSVKEESKSKDSLQIGGSSSHLPHKDVKDDKKAKRDSKSEIKVPNVESSDSFPIPQSNTQSEVDTSVSATGKSKQNASQKSKESQKPSLPQTQKTTAPIVPQPQPSKSGGKSGKKSELNIKGANKEGTDMDAFNDNVTVADAVNANVTNVNTNSDIINANSVPAQPTVKTADVRKTSENNDSVPTTTTVKPEPKALPKKIDVTQVFGDSLVGAKPQPPPVILPSSDHSHDETDRVDKLVKAKNEANVKVSSENSDSNIVIETKSNLPYKDGQWAPDNVDGKMKYDKDFLMALRDAPPSKQKPPNLPDIVLSDDRARIGDGRFSIGSRAADYITPSFQSYGGKSSSRGPPISKRPSAGKPSNNKGNKSNNGKISISLREEIKLHESENAWRPARLNPTEVVRSEDDKKTEDLYKKVRGVLNKLTPQKFETLVSQVRNLNIQTEDRLQGVIDLVFEKAVDEPNFSVAYAMMCRELALMQVPTAKSTESDKQYVNFRKLLITRCQYEFEKQSRDESVRNEKLKEIEECTDAAKKKELEFDLEEYDRRIRMKSVGNVRFIGELFKIQMLTANIMVQCLENLLQAIDEERLECLCKLLSTIGKELELTKKSDLTKYFTIMQEIVDKKHGKISSRIRFMLQDVIDLRKSKWVPRRQDLNPKTIDQIQKEAENEHIQSMNSVPATTRKDDRSSSSSKNKNKSVSDDGWTMPSRSRAQFTVQSDKLKNRAPQLDEPLGSSQMFGSWTRGSNMKTQPTTAPLTNTANMYAALENMDPDKKMLGSRSSSKDPYLLKGSSLERSSYKQSFDGRSSRSGSQQRLNESTSLSSSQRSTPVSVAPATPQKPPSSTPALKLTEEQLERSLKNSLEEYLNDNLKIDEYEQEIVSILPESYLPRLVADGYLNVIDKYKVSRLKTGTLFAKLIKSGTIPLEEYCVGLEEVLNQSDDLTIDIPKLWECLAEALVPVICEEALPLRSLHKSSEVLISQGHAPKLIAPLFKLVVNEKGAKFLQQLWKASGLSIADFMPAEKVDSFIQENQLEFLRGGDTPVGESQFTMDQIYNKLLDFLKVGTPLDDITSWITSNVGERVKENKFIRLLATAIFTTSINQGKLAPDILQSLCTTLLQKYVDGNQNYELQCLYALQALVHKMEHPQGLLLMICNKLFEIGIFPQESFTAWETSTDPAEQEGKGVALKQLTSFFTQLKENEDYEDGEDGSTGSEDA